MINFEYSRVTSVKAAIDIISKNPGSGFIAGGTNLVDLMKKGVMSPSRLIDINQLPLKQIEDTDKGLHIGALAINSEVAADRLVQEKYPLLAMALKAGASAQLRNMATVGGNMMQRTRCGYFYDTAMPCNKRQPGSGCGAIGGYNRMHAILGTSPQCIAVHPSDMCVALAALDATVHIAGAKGERVIRFTDFHRLPGTTPQFDNNLQKGELITGITIPSAPLYKHVRYLKIRDRASYAFALVSVAAAFELKGSDKVIQSARLAMGGVAHKPWRLTAAEKFLIGKKAGEDVFKQAAALAMKDARSFGSNDFKLKMAPAAILQACVNATDIT
ncbi:MAG: FAD-binding molybdopterin dehydrogenase [Citrobacter freundii]|nr:MAG: FAD-binding molybdopterin dehydrogenase [Citrobacter freundii]